VYKTLGLLRHTFNTTNSVHVKKLLYLIYHWYAHNSLTAPSSGSPTYTRISSCWRIKIQRWATQMTTLPTINHV